MSDKNIKVLLVDDEPDFTAPMTNWFQSKGYSVLVAATGERAIQMVKDDMPDIIFLDIYMPGMDGAQTLSKIREFNKTIPVIIISAYVDDQRTREAAKHNISGIFYKCKEFQEGLALLESTLKAHKQLKKKQ